MATTMTPVPPILLGDTPVGSLADYRRAGGLDAWRRVVASSPEAVVEIIRQSGLRGRGGGGFPTATKWEAVRGSTSSRKFAVCNGAEGEPGTFKDRWLVRRNPYQVVEGLAIAAHVVGAERAYLCVKRNFHPERRRLDLALAELQGAGVAANVELVLGPDEYLFGEEKAMLEVIEGGLPLPRVLPPYLHGLFGGAYGGPSDTENNPTAVNNVETLAHVPHIIRNGPGWFRCTGVPDTPGTMVFTLSGDVRGPGIVELPLGLTLGSLIFDHAGGLAEGRRVKAVFPGLANAVITEAGLDLPLAFDTMRDAGSALGSGGFVVYDDTACMVRVAREFERFLYIESCNQCAPCKLGGQQMTDRLELLLAGNAEPHHLDELADIAGWVTDGQRCYLATSQSLVTASVLDAFRPDFEAHLAGACRLRHDITLPKMTDYSEHAGFTYDAEYVRKQADWTYA